MKHKYDIFHIENNNVQPERGNILISEPFLNDWYFGRSVVFLVDHDIMHGSVGLVLNKPLKEKMGDFFPQYKFLSDIPLFQGGPVCTNKLYYIHTLGNIIPGSSLVEDGIYFDGDFDAIKDYIAEGHPINGQIKFFLGYSGWEQDQLSNEISHHSWLVSKFDKSRMMKPEGEVCWKRSLEALGDRYKPWANFPKQPFMN